MVINGMINKSNSIRFTSSAQMPYREGCCRSYSFTASLEECFIKAINFSATESKNILGFLIYILYLAGT